MLCCSMWVKNFNKYVDIRKKFLFRTAIYREQSLIFDHCCDMFRPCSHVPTVLACFDRAWPNFDMFRPFSFLVEHRYVLDFESQSKVRTKTQVALKTCSSVVKLGFPQLRKLIIILQSLLARFACSKSEKKIISLRPVLLWHWVVFINIFRITT